MYYMIFNLLKNSGGVCVQRTVFSYTYTSAACYVYKTLNSTRLLRRNIKSVIYIETPFLTYLTVYCVSTTNKHEHNLDMSVRY